MSRFSQIKKYDIRERTSFVDMPELGDGARIEVKTTADTNKGYYNGVLRIGTKRSRELAKKKVVDTDDIVRDRRDAASLFPKHVMVSFDRVPDENGDLLEYSEEVGKELVEELIKTAPHLFDRIRDHAGELVNFYDDIEVAGDPSELAENSPTGSSGN